MPPSHDSYVAPRWLPGGHAQTIYAARFAPRPAVAYRRERWRAPDGDFVDLDWAVPPRVRADERIAPLVTLFHGLEGDSRSHYALSLMHAALALGWRGAVVHFRGCSGEPNRLARAYHSGDSAEIDWILRRLRDTAGDAPLFAAGISLGGNALLRWLGERGRDAAAVVDAAGAVSAPVDLTAAGDALGSGFNLVYTRNFLATMKVKALSKLERHPGLYDAVRVQASRTLREFDDLVTAPLHGFRDVDDYWTRASAKPVLRDIRVPTLLINARNDPFLPATALPLPQELSPMITAEFPHAGGHVGFVTGGLPGRLDWLPARLLRFMAGATENTRPS